MVSFYGIPSGMMIAENWIHDVAAVVGKEPTNVRYTNLYRKGQITHLNQTVESNSLERCWMECLKQSEYERQKVEIHEFNARNRWKKRGIAAIPTMYGIAFNVPFLNQAGKDVFELSANIRPLEGGLY